MILRFRRLEMLSPEHARGGGVKNERELGEEFKKTAEEILQALSTTADKSTPEEIIREVRQFARAHTPLLKQELPNAPSDWKAEQELLDFVMRAVRKLAQERLVSSTDSNEREIMAHIFDALDPIHRLEHDTTEATDAEDDEALAA